MSLFKSFAIRAQSKAIDIVMMTLDMLITKIGPLLLSWLFGDALVGSAGEHIIATTSIEPDDLKRIVSNFFFLCFMFAFIGAALFRFLISGHKISIPLSEAPRMGNMFTWIGMAGYLLVVGCSASLAGYLDFPRLAAIWGGSMPGTKSPSAFFVGAFIASTAIFYMFLHSIFCYWLMLPSLRVISQPNWARRIPRLLSRFEFRDKFGNV